MATIYSYRVLLFSIMLCGFCFSAKAQYAIGGTAGPALVNSVYWLTWDKAASGATLLATPAGADANHIINGTYIWQPSASVRITANITNEAFINGDKMISYTPGNYSGDGLDLIYSGNNLPKPASRGVANSGLATTDKETVSFDIDLKVAILINQVWVDVDYPGMIIADAESLNGLSEFISGTTPNSIAWELLNKRTEGNPNDSHYKLQLSGNSTTFKLFVDQPPGDFGVQAVLFAKGAKNLTNVTMKGEGLTAMAIGFIFPFDFGDAPQTYGSPGAYIDNFKATDAFTADGTYAVIQYPTISLVPQATVYIGDNNVDADGTERYSTDAKGDDTTGNDDENTIDPLKLADIKVGQTTDITFQIPVTNTKTVAATLYAWLDFNNDGIISPGEMVSVPVPPNAQNQTLNVTFPNSIFKNIIKSGPLYARLRITTSILNDDTTTAIDERSVAASGDGEIEDYRLKDIFAAPVSALGLTKAANNSGTKPGDVINYTLIATNTGNTTLTNVLVSDPRVDAGSISPAAVTNLAAGKSATFTAKYTLTQADVDAGRRANQALVAGTDSLSNIVNQKSDDPATPVFGDSTIVLIPELPGIHLVKTGIYSGNSINYSFAITNTGNVTLHAVNLTDVKLGLNNFMVPVVGAGLAPGASVNFSSVYTVTQNDFSAGGVTNKAIGEGTAPNNTIVTDTTICYSAVPQGQAPIAVNDTAITAVNKPVIISILANDNPGNSTFDVASVQFATNPQNGNVILNLDGSVTYTPADGYFGKDVFTYKVKNQLGIYTNVATVTITIAQEGDLHVPNVFTPNGDGINDVFEIKLLDQYQDNHLSIINRWGNEVYKMDNYKNTWRGDGLNEGTYYYILRVKRNVQSDWETYKGYVMLLRTFIR